MTSYDKVVKLACKPKAAAPKAKYLDPIIAATWTDDGAVHDVCKALSPRFREPNAIVVFKALIVLHTMIRNGATDNVLGYLSSSSEVLRLHNVSAGNWDGYRAPSNLQHYATYLDSRIRAYKDIKHDAVRVQAESNRDLRMSVTITDDAHQLRPGPSADMSSSAVNRSKTVAGRKLRVMTVEKGLLRETKVVQKMIDHLVECRFYLDDLEDELTITALRMLVKDLLTLFQACNEGVINVLEHYFEMSHVDATEAIKIYKHFCKQTEHVVEYLGVAKKLQNLLSVPIPNLKHAPVSLVASLQEYLNDPNFEQHRIEYRASKAVVDKVANPSGTSKTKNASTKAAPLEKETSPAATESAASSSKAPASSLSSIEEKGEPTKNMLDFFSAIEEEQPTMFDPQTNSPSATYYQQQVTTNPFSVFGPGNMMNPQQQQTPFGQMQMQMQPQPTGIIIPQPTALPMLQQPRSPSNPFNAQLAPNNAFLQAQPTAAFLQPQVTGVNPFRQSMMFPQMTGAGPFFGAGAVGAGISMGPSPFMNANMGQDQTAAAAGGVSGPFGQPMSAPPPNSAPSAASSFVQFGAPSVPGAASSSQPQFQTQSQPSAATTLSNLPPRPASTPLTNDRMLQPVKTHQTGSRNPFGTPLPDLPPVPKQPTLKELTLASGGFGTTDRNVNGAQEQQQQQQPQLFGALNSNAGGFGAGEAHMGAVASSFLFNQQDKAGSGAPGSTTGMPSFLNAQTTATTTAGSAPSDTFFSVSNATTGATTFSGMGASSGPGSPTLKPQMTGFGGIKPFKPSSSFGASLLEALPPVPQSNLDMPNGVGGAASATSGAPSGATAVPSFLSQQPTGFRAFGAQGTSSPFGALPGVAAGISNPSLGVGLRPQMTGGGVANPFRASMAVTDPSRSSAATSFGGPSSSVSLMGLSAFGAGGAFGSGGTPTGGASLFGAQGASSGFGSAFPPPIPTAAAQPQPQQNVGSSI